MVKKKRPKKPAKKRKLTKKRPKLKPRQDWLKLKKRFMAREWLTTEAMSTALKVSLSTCYKNTRGWLDERQELDRETADRVFELIVQDRVKLEREADARQYKMAVELQLKAGNRLLGKVRDKVSGLMVEREFDSDQVALAALRLGAMLERAVLNKHAPGDTPPLPAAAGVERGLIIDAAGDFHLDNVNAPAMKARLRELRAEDLLAIMDAPEPNDSGTKKAGGAGAARKDASQG